MPYDFLHRLPHPETNETACTWLAPSAKPLAPISDREALCCAGAWENGYLLAVVYADAPCEVALLTGAAPDTLTPAKVLEVGTPVTRVSLLQRQGRMLLAVAAGPLRILTLEGQPVAYLDAPADAALSVVGEDCLLTAGATITLLDEAWRPVESMSMCASTTDADKEHFNTRRDALAIEGRTAPGDHGSLFSYGGKVYYACRDDFFRCHMANSDTFLCEADSWRGPWSRRYLAVPNGGSACFFTDGNGVLYAAMVGAAPHSAVHGKAALLPMEAVEDGFLRPCRQVITETLPGASIQPLPMWDEIRDSFVYRCEADGWYYITGTTKRPGGTYWSSTGGIRLWRTKDFASFESFGVVYDYLTQPDTWQEQVARAANTWAPEIVFHEGTFWLTYSTAPGCGLLKSVTGKPEGPYQYMGRVVMKGIDSGFYQEDGTLYLVWQNGRIAPFNTGCTTFTEEPVLLLPEDGQQVGYEGAGVIKYRGKYILYAAEWNGDLRIDGTYDMMYSVSDSLMGPYSPRRVLVPHGGHGSLFIGPDGGLWFSMFGNDRTAAFRHGIGIGKVNLPEDL